MGIAFLGIGHILGFDNAMTAGAVISGAFFRK
jgi:NhaC family Na+:H+ antiporter